MGAQSRAAGRAVVAAAAKYRQAGHDMIARFYVSDVRADLLDYAGRLVAEHGRQWMRIEPFHEMQIGMTEPGDSGADQHLARTGFWQADVLDHQRLVDFIQAGGLHSILPKSCVVLESGLVA